MPKVNAPLLIEDDPANMVVTIEGVKYSYEFFRNLGVSGLPPGSLFKIVSRDADAGALIITVEEVKTP